MRYGTAYLYTENTRRRSNTICVQKKSNTRDCWPWWTHSQHRNIYSRKRNQNSVFENVPVPDSLERSLPPGRLTRREYQIRLMEARYPCSFRGNLTESKEHSECDNEDGSSEPSRFIFGNKSAQTRTRASETNVPTPEKRLPGDRRAFNDTVCNRVFQSVGSDVIAHWLTPKELSAVETAFQCSWDWARVWHHGKVKNRALASRLELQVNTCTVDYLIKTNDRDEVFSAFWYILPLERFLQIAYQYSHYPSIRRLCLKSS